jgi:lysyl-tRNA synthetase class I
MPRSRWSNGSATRSITSMTATCPTAVPPVSFALLLNLVGVLGTNASEQVRTYLARYLPDASEIDPALDALIPYAIALHRDFVAPTLQRRAPEAVEVEALRALDASLAAIGDAADLAGISRTRSMKSARPSTARSVCATGSRHCTRHCSAPSKARAWGAFLHSMGSTTAGS